MECEEIYPPAVVGGQKHKTRRWRTRIPALCQPVMQKTWSISSPTCRFIKTFAAHVCVCVCVSACTVESHATHPSLRYLITDNYVLRSSRATTPWTLRSIVTAAVIKKLHFLFLFFLNKVFFCFFNPPSQMNWCTIGALKASVQLRNNEE